MRSTAEIPQGEANASQCQSIEWGRLWGIVCATESPGGVIVCSVAADQGTFPENVALVGRARFCKLTRFLCRRVLFSG